jgi:hypothetical protein
LKEISHTNFSQGKKDQEDKRKGVKNNRKGYPEREKFQKREKGREKREKRHSNDATSTWRLKNKNDTYI